MIVEGCERKRGIDLIPSFWVLLLLNGVSYIKPVDGPELSRKDQNSSLEHLGSPVDCHLETSSGQVYESGFQGDVCALEIRSVRTIRAYSKVEGRDPYKGEINQEGMRLCPVCVCVF
jgi:hypothetical protein